MQYTDQTSGSIRLYLTEGDFDLDQFEVLAHADRVWDDLLIEYGILGESHYLRFKNGEHVLNEICACTDAALSENEKIVVQDLLPNLSQDTFTHRFCSFEYTFDFHYAAWEEGQTKLARMREEARDERLRHVFPSMDEHAEVPVTEIYLYGSETLCVNTVHTYPNEQMLVFTKSTLARKT